MSKKHFDTLAQELASVRPSSRKASQYKTWLVTVEAVAKACATHNPLFDNRRFIKACETLDGAR